MLLHRNVDRPVALEELEEVSLTHTHTSHPHCHLTVIYIKYSIMLRYEVKLAAIVKLSSA